MADASVTTSTPDTTAGKPIDVETVTTGAGTVNRQVVALGDPATGGQRATVTAGNALKVDNSSVTQPVSGTVTANIGTAGTLALDATVSAVQPRRIQDGVGATLATVTAGNALKTDGSAVTQPVSAAALPLPAGAATEATLARINTQGQKAMAASTPVVIASDQSKILVTPDSVALPANQSVNINQVGGAAITEGQKAMAASVPVVVASDQSAVPISGTVTGNQGTALAQTGAGWPVQPWGMTDTLFASGNVANPAAGAAIATLTTPAAGTYRLDLFVFQYVPSATVETVPDMELRKGAAVQIGNLGGFAAQLSTATVVGETGFKQTLQNIRITLDGATNVSINATTGGVSSGNYVAHLILTRIF